VASASQRGGAITVGEQSWTIILSTQCSVYPGPIVNIAGHAKDNPSLEIVIDYGGPTGARIDNDGSAEGWHAIRETLKVEIDGKRIQGTATFNKMSGGSGDSAEGSFDVQC